MLISQQSEKTKDAGPRLNIKTILSDLFTEDDVMNVVCDIPCIYDKVTMYNIDLLIGFVKSTLYVYGLKPVPVKSRKMI